MKITAEDNIAKRTDRSGGTVGTTTTAMSATYTQAEVANGFAFLTSKMNAIIDALVTVGILEAPVASN